MKSYLMSLWRLAAVLIFAAGCAKHEFSQLETKPIAIAGEEEPPPPDKAPSIIWVQVPEASLSTDQPVTIIYDIVPGTSPITDIACLVDGKPVQCDKDGDTITIVGGTPGGHELQIIVTDGNGLQDNEKVPWDLYEKFQKVKTPLNIADEDDQVDVLFVVDNSKSMKDEQTNMANKITNFLDRVKGLDWRIAISTTDMQDKVLGDGRFLKYPNGSYYITSALSTTVAKDQFGKTIQRKEDGHFEEQGIKSAYRAIQRAVSPSEALDQQNKNFFRSKAALSVVVLSDENETGTATANKGTELVKLVQKTWGKDKLFKFNSIIVRPGDTACLKASPDHFVGQAYADLTKLTDGIMGNICEKDYGNQLSVIGQDIANEQNTFALTCLPMDLNGDGQPEVSVIGSGAPKFQVVGQTVVFDNPPKAGKYSIEYYCPKK